MGKLDFFGRIKSAGGAIAAPYKVYVANLTQTGTSNPVATVLESTFPILPVWTRSLQGQFLMTSAAAFGDATKVYIIIQGVWYEQTFTDACFSLFGVNDSNSLLFYTLKFATPTTYDDALFNNTTVEIRVYP